ncbi:ABC transporter permease [Streptomyces sp. NPDC006649]|uniref:ABC transporter permease n=1 Tax=Streptomyces sp. NPDC006649 TaxID=3156896 RepID=UPI0033AD25C8
MSTTGARTGEGGVEQTAAEQTAVEGATRARTGPGDRTGAGARGEGGSGERVRTFSTGRMLALARAELTLLGRSKASLLTMLVLPVAMTFTISSTTDQATLDKAGLTAGAMLLPGAIGFSLLFALHHGVVGVLVVRREQLVLKRLRTGEARDTEILAGASLSSVIVALVQCAVLTAGCAVFFDMSLPPAPQLLFAGVALGVVMLTALGAATAGITKSAEASQLTVIPLMLATMAGSGVFVPLEIFPDRLASVCELLPLTPVVELVRGAWTGSMSASDAFGHVLTALAWTVLSVLAVRRWFRWEPRR